MTDYQTFPHAPIAEAVLDIGVVLPETTVLHDLDKLHAMISDRYPGRDERVMMRGDIRMAPAEGHSFSSTSQIDGYLFRSPIEGKVVQSRLDGFSFNKLKPYESWERFSSEAKEMWTLYRGVARPTKVKRIALRYINKIELPLPLSDFEDYFITFPKVAPEIPQTFLNIFMRLEIPNEVIQAIGVITLTFQAPVEMRLPVIFDIDVIKEAEYATNLDRIWEDIEKLREYKNCIFFNSLTAKAKELFL